MHVTVVGSGYVGLVSSACLASLDINVICVEQNLARVKSLQQDKLPLYEPGLAELIANNRPRLTFSSDLPSAVACSEIVFVAVGTPTSPDGQADTSAVFTATQQIAAAIDKFTIIATKSTVPVGTGRRIIQLIQHYNAQADFAVCANPEFLREGAAINDFMYPHRIVIGSNSERATTIMTQLYRCLTNQPILVTTLESAELIKYTANAFLATKVTFINELTDLCERLGADIQTIAHGIGLDARINNKFLRPGPGYGGSCFPKDTLALVTTAQQHGVPLQIVETVIKVNEQRQQQMAQRIITNCGGNVKGVRIAALGVTFKAGTDDVRSSPALTILTTLCQAGAILQVYDPAGMDNAKPLLSDSITWCTDSYQAVQDADAVVILTDWQEFKDLDLKQVHTLMRQPLMIDLRNIYQPKQVIGSGLRYVGLGRPSPSLKE